MIARGAENCKKIRGTAQKMREPSGSPICFLFDTGYLVTDCIQAAFFIHKN
jgi:hypothetical protein